MDVLGVGLATILLFVALGGMVGVIFGFFGMGSFLVTPALIVMGYPSRVVVGSGLAFVFGTAVIGTLRHRDFGQVDYRLGVVLILGTVLGIEVGKRGVLALEALGVAGLVVGITYVLLLSGIGLLVILEASGRDSPKLASRVLHVDSDIGERAWSLDPQITPREGDAVSVWVVFGVAVVAGVLAGFLGVGGGFLRMPALTYLFGMSLPVAVGTNIFSVMISGAFGSYTWAQVGGVDLSIVAPLLVGSGLGARIGTATTQLVDEDEMKIYFGLLLVAGAVAVAMRQLGDGYGIDVLADLSLVLLLGAALLVNGAVLYSGILELRPEGNRDGTSAD